MAGRAEERGDMLQGTLDMLILKALQLEENALQVNQGSLYPALYRLKRQGWITSAWQTTENNRRARYYALTPAGQRQLAAEHRNWDRLARAVDLVMQMSPS